jgi:hypothetical protein
MQPCYCIVCLKQYYFASVCGKLNQPSILKHTNMPTYPSHTNNTAITPFYHTPRTRQFLEAKKLKEIYWMVDYRLPCDIARKIMRKYLFPRDIIQTIVAVEEDDFWTMHSIWQGNGTCNFLKPPGTPLHYQIMNLNIFVLVDTIF